MKKYIEIGKITFKAELAYRFDVFVGIFVYQYLGYCLASYFGCFYLKVKVEIGGFSFKYDGYLLYCHFIFQ